MNSVYQVHHQQQQQQPQQSPSKLPGACFRCNQPGHWVKDCPEKPNSWNPISPSIPATTCDPEFKSTYCPCGAGLCEIKISRSHNNPNRKYYSCPGKSDMSCKYFKWCDQLRKEEIREVQPSIGYPKCDCQAGICSVKVEEHGVNAGRSYFACPIKKGDGACNFRQWLDNPPELASVVSADTSDEQTSMFDDFELGHEAEMQVDALDIVDHENPAEDFQANLENGEKSLEGVCRSPVKSPENHSHPAQIKMLKNSETKMNIPVSDALKHPTGDSRVEDEKSCVTTVAILKNPISKGPSPNFNLLTISEDNVPVNPYVSNPQIPLKDGLYEGSIMAGNILQALDKLALGLQNDLTTLLESMGPQNYDIMRLEVDCTFAALDRLEVDYGPLKWRVSEYISHAVALAHIEQTINNDSSSQELLSRFYSEQSRFLEISNAQRDAKNAFMASNNKVNLLREKASSLEDGSAEIEMELSCCEIENVGHRENLRQITKVMSECKERLQDASQEATDALRISEKREIQLSAAKGAFERARAQLRNQNV